MLDDPRLPPRFWVKVVPEPTTGCWLWIAGSRGGYGTFHWEGRDQGAHQVAYKVLVGVLAAGLELDHLCKTTECCNPAHLEPVTHAENMRRGTVWEFHRNKTHCPKQHECVGNNLHINVQGKRVCKTCARENMRRYRAQQK